MKKTLYPLFLCMLIACCSACTLPSKHDAVILGDEQFDTYLPMLQSQRVALLSNQTGLVHHNGQYVHILDTLLAQGIEVTAIFSPEHGFRGTADAGELIRNDIDPKTGVPILSLYSSHGDNHPAAESMQQFDVLVVDIQDVGLRYYTYYITLCRLIEACGAYNKQVLILDRPNPNGHYVDGPILDMSLKSGVGALPIPIVHGMTLGELARMAQGEQWLDSAGNICQLTIIPCKNYTHQTLYTLPVPPSPNLPNMQAIYLYPSLCPFEGTCVSLGRGTDKPFQIYGHPLMRQKYDFSFVPTSRFGAKHPPLEGDTCYGVDLSHIPTETILRDSINLTYVIDAYNIINAYNHNNANNPINSNNPIDANNRIDANNLIGDSIKFFRPFFDKLMGQTYVRAMIEQGSDNQAIRARWGKDVEAFKQQRRKYLLYEE